jgi:cell division protein FtsQ
MVNKIHIKKWLWSTAWVVVGIAVIVILIAAMQKNKNQICSKIEVNILSNHEQMFLTEQNILDLIKAKSIINIKSITEVDIKYIEQLIEKNIWIQDVEVYFDKGTVLYIDVQERMPMCRMFRQNGNSFYMDKKHFILPLSTAYSAKVPVFTGFGNNVVFNNNDSIALESINKMATFVSNNEFWMAQIQQINIVNNDEFEIIPTIGNHTVLFGDTVDMTDKFNKLFKFYKSVSTKVGFDKYALLNIQFKNQIVATTKNYSTVIDTAKANQTIQNFIQASMDTSFVTIDTTLPIKKRDTNVVVRPKVAPRTIVPKTVSPRVIAPIKQQQTSINKQPRTTAPKATMPKRPVVNRSNNQQRSQH